VPVLVPVLVPVRSKTRMLQRSENRRREEVILGRRCMSEWDSLFLDGTAVAAVVSHWGPCRQTETLAFVDSGGWE